MPTRIRIREEDSFPKSILGYRPGATANGGFPGVDLHHPSPERDRRASLDTNEDDSDPLGVAHAGRSHLNW